MNYDFDEDLLNEDINWFKPFFNTVLGSYDYTKTCIEQDLKGVDCYVNGKSVQCKIRNQFYKYDLCIEYSHQFTDKEIRGWGWSVPTAEYLFYGWKNCFRGKDNICLVIPFNKLHEFFKNHRNEYKVIENKYPSNRNGKKWLTSCIFVPIKDLRRYMPVGHYSISPGDSDVTN